MLQVTGQQLCTGYFVIFESENSLQNLDSSWLCDSSFFQPASATAGLSAEPAVQQGCVMQHWAARHSCLVVCFCFICGLLPTKQRCQGNLIGNKHRGQTNTTKKKKTRIVLSAVYSVTFVLLSTTCTKGTRVKKTGCIITRPKILINPEYETKFQKCFQSDGKNWQSFRTASLGAFQPPFPQ